MAIAGWVKIGVKADTDKFDKQIADIEDKIRETEQRQKLVNNETKGYQQELRQAQNEVNRLTKEYDELVTSAEKLKSIIEAQPKIKNGAFNKERDDNIRQYEEMVQKIDEVANALSKAEGNQSKIQAKAQKSKLHYDKLVGSVNRFKGKIENINVKKTEEEIKKVSNSLEDVERNTVNSVKSIGRMALGLFGLRSAYMFITQASGTVAQYDKEYATNLEYIRYALAMGIAPALRYIVNLAGQLLQYVNAIVSAWFGIKGGIFKSAQDFENAKKSSAGVASNSKKIKENLAGFDELNVLNQDTGNEGGGGGDTAPSIELGELGEMEIPAWLQWVLDNGDLLKNIIFGIGLALEGIKLADLAQGLGLIEDKMPFLQKLGGIILIVWGIVGAVKSFLDYLKDPTWQNFGKIVQNIGIAILGVGLLIASVPVMVAGAVVAIVGIILRYWDIIREKIQSGIDWLASKSDWIHEKLGDTIGVIYDAIVETFGNVLKIFDSVFTAIKGVLDGIIKVVKGVFTGDWELAWEGVKQIFSSVWEGIKGIFKGIINTLLAWLEAFINAWITMINGVIRTLNLLQIDIPDWVPGVGGQTWGFNIAEVPMVQLPRLARGGLINKPTQAIIGERGKEAVLPLENNTEWMEQLAEIVGSQDININFTGNMAQLVRMLNPEIIKENKRTGRKMIGGIA